MTVKHIRKNYQQAQVQPVPISATNPGAGPPMSPPMQRPNMGPMPGRMGKVQDTNNSSNKSWVFGVILILLVIAALWYFMTNKKKGSVSYFY
jgi:hypothetical protein